MADFVQSTEGTPSNLDKRAGNLKPDEDSEDEGVPQPKHKVKKTTKNEDTSSSSSSESEAESVEEDDVQNENRTTTGTMDVNINTHHQDSPDPVMDITKNNTGIRPITDERSDNTDSSSSSESDDERVDGENEDVDDKDERTEPPIYAAKVNNKDLPPPQIIITDDPVQESDETTPNFNADVNINESIAEAVIDANGPEANLGITSQTDATVNGSSSSESEDEIRSSDDDSAEHDGFPPTTPHKQNDDTAGNQLDSLTNDNNVHENVVEECVVDSPSLEQPPETDMNGSYSSSDRGEGHGRIFTKSNPVADVAVSNFHVEPPTHIGDTSSSSGSDSEDESISQGQDPNKLKSEDKQDDVVEQNEFLPPPQNFSSEELPHYDLPEFTTSTQNNTATPLSDFVDEHKFTHKPSITDSVTCVTEQKVEQPPETNGTTKEIEISQSSNGGDESYINSGNIMDPVTDIPKPKVPVEQPPCTYSSSSSDSEHERSSAEENALPKEKSQTAGNRNLEIDSNQTETFIMEAVAHVPSPIDRVEHDSNPDVTAKESDSSSSLDCEDVSSSDERNFLPQEKSQRAENLKEDQVPHPTIIREALTHVPSAEDQIEEDPQNEVIVKESDSSSSSESEDESSSEEEENLLPQENSQTAVNLKLDQVPHSTITMEALTPSPQVEQDPQTEVTAKESDSSDSSESEDEGSSAEETALHTQKSQPAENLKVVDQDPRQSGILEAATHVSPPKDPIEQDPQTAVTAKESGSSSSSESEDESSSKEEETFLPQEKSQKAENQKVDQDPYPTITMETHTPSPNDQVEQDPQTAGKAKECDSSSSSESEAESSSEEEETTQQDELLAKTSNEMDCKIEENKNNFQSLPDTATAVYEPTVNAEYAAPELVSATSPLKIIVAEVHSVTDNDSSHSDATSLSDHSELVSPVTVPLDSVSGADVLSHSDGTDHNGHQKNITDEYGQQEEEQQLSETKSLTTPILSRQSSIASDERNNAPSLETIINLKEISSWKVDDSASCIAVAKNDKIHVTRWTFDNRGSIVTYNRKGIKKKHIHYKSDNYSGIAVSKLGYVIALNVNKNRIEEYNGVDGKKVRNVKLEQCKDPTAVDIMPTGQFIVVDQERNALLVYSTNNYGRVKVITHDLMKEPNDVACSNDGFYVTCGTTRCVIKFDLKGNLLWSYKGELKVPKGICVDENGSVYVVDRVQHTIFVFEKDGQLKGRLQIDENATSKLKPWFVSVRDGIVAVLYERNIIKTYELV